MPWFELDIQNAASTGGKKNATLKVTGVIGGSWLSDGTSAKQFLQQLEMAGDVGTIDVIIDSPGGSIADGFTMFDALRAHPAKVTTNVIGTAASMASVLMLAGDVRQIAENGRVMVHRATGGVSGTHEEITRYAQILKQYEDRLVQAYVDHTGNNEKAVREMMNTLVGTWFFGAEAVKKGFATEVTKGAKAAAFHREWAGFFDVLPSALFDTSPTSESNTTDTIDMKPEEITSLIAKGIKDGLADHAKASNDAIAALKDGMKAEITNALKPAVDEAMKPVNEKLDGLKNVGDDLKELSERLDKAENVIKSGVLRNAGGTAPVHNGGEGGEEGGSDAAPKNEAELRAAMAKVSTFEEKRKLKSAFEARQKK